MKIHWTTIGEKFTQNKQQEITTLTEKMAWIELPTQLDMMSGMAIQSAIQHFHIPKAERVSVSNDMAPFGLIGIESVFQQGLVRTFLVDDGCNLTPICSHLFFEEENIECKD